MIFNQSESDVRCEWGLRGLKELERSADVVIIIDVLSFTTAVDIAVARGASVFPFPARDSSAERYAQEVNAELASQDRRSGHSLSPASLLDLPRGHRLVLPSPNGAALSFAATHAVVLAGCLRNASAVARVAAAVGKTFAVIPAGEQWESGELRPCVEDLLGAGAIISELPGRRSPEAELAVACFQQFKGNHQEVL